MGNSARELLRILAIAACAAGALLPFYEQARWPWLWTGAGLAAAAGLAGAVVTLITKRRNSTMAMVGGMFVRFFVALAGLGVCCLVAREGWTTIATALLPAYLGILACDLWVACRHAHTANPVEVHRC